VINSLGYVLPKSTGQWGVCAEHFSVSVSVFGWKRKNVSKKVFAFIDFRFRFIFIFIFLNRPIFIKKCFKKNGKSLFFKLNTFITKFNLNMKKN